MDICKYFKRRRRKKNNEARVAFKHVSKRRHRIHNIILLYRSRARHVRVQRVSLFVSICAVQTERRRTVRQVFFYDVIKQE